MQASLLCSFQKVGSMQERKKQAWSKARTTRPVEDTLNGVNGLGCLTTAIFEQSPGSAEVSRTFQAHRGDGQGKRRRQGAAHT